MTTCHGQGCQDPEKCAFSDEKRSVAAAPSRTAVKIDSAIIELHRVLQKEEALKLCGALPSMLSYISAQATDTTLGSVDALKAQVKNGARPSTLDE